MISRERNGPPCHPVATGLIVGDFVVFLSTGFKNCDRKLHNFMGNVSPTKAN